MEMLEEEHEEIRWTGGLVRTVCGNPYDCLSRGVAKDISIEEISESMKYSCKISKT